MAEDFEDEQYSGEEHAEEGKAEFEEELEGDEIEDWEEGFSKGAEKAEFEEGEELDLEEGEEKPKKKKKQEEEEI